MTFKVNPRSHFLNRTVNMRGRVFAGLGSKTIRKCCQELTKTFLSSGVSEPRTSAEYIVAHAIDRKTLSGVNRDAILGSHDLSRITHLARKRLQQMPLQYVLKEWDFRDLTIELRPPVFIPRPETENFVTLALHDPTVCKAMRFLEVGCGSGAICISLLKSLPMAQCLAVDCSEAACDLTRLNAQRNDIADRLTILNESWNSDLVSKLKKDEKEFDFLISNPPYISSEDMLMLQPEISRYEDSRALWGGTDGLDVIRDIVNLAPQLIRRNGTVWLEVDLSHPEAIQQMTANSSVIRYLASHSDFTHRLRFCQLEVIV